MSQPVDTATSPASGNSLMVVGNFAAPRNTGFDSAVTSLEAYSLNPIAPSSQSIFAPVNATTPAVHFPSVHSALFTALLSYGSSGAVIIDQEIRQMMFSAYGHVLERQPLVISNGDLAAIPRIAARQTSLILLGSESSNAWARAAEAPTLSNYQNYPDYPAPVPTVGFLREGKSAPESLSFRPQSCFEVRTDPERNSATCTGTAEDVIRLLRFGVYRGCTNMSAEGI